MSKILVTGGAGFIGSHVVDGYVREGHEVIVVDNLLTGSLENINRHAKFYLVDIRSRKDLEDVFQFERPEIVNHHAAQISVPASVSDPVLDASINIIGFLNILECSVRYNVRKIVFISTGGAIYGDTGDYPSSEDSPVNPLSPYSVTKLASEKYLVFYKQRYGIDYTILRYANIYGPRQIPHGEAGVVAIFIENILNGRHSYIYRFPEEPEGMLRDYCYVGDVVKANILALERGSGEIINIGTGRATSTLELYRTICSLIGTDSYIEPIFAPPRDGDLRRSCLVVDKAWRVLNWKAETPLDVGLRKTIEHFRSRMRGGR